MRALVSFLLELWLAVADQCFHHTLRMTKPWFCFQVVAGIVLLPSSGLPLLSNQPVSPHPFRITASNGWNFCDSFRCIVFLIVLMHTVSSAVISRYININHKAMFENLLYRELKFSEWSCGDNMPYCRTPFRLGVSVCKKFRGLVPCCT